MDQKRKPDKLKVKANQNINLQDYVVFQDNSLKEFFKYKKSGPPSFIAVCSRYIFVGAIQYVYGFTHDSDFKEYRVLGSEQKQRGVVTFMQVYKEHLIVTYSNEEFALFNIDTLKEIWSSDNYHVEKAMIVPGSCDGFANYVEVLIQMKLNYIVKIPIEVGPNECTEQLSCTLYKFGEPSSKQKFKIKFAVHDSEYLPPMSRSIQDVAIMQQSLDEHIQFMDEKDRDSASSQDIPIKVKKKKSSLLQRLFSNNKTKQEVHRISSYSYLLAVAFPHRIQVMKVQYGYKLPPEQCKLMILLSFNRPDAFIYDLVFHQPPPKSAEACQISVKSKCTWGLGNFKETNKRYVLLVVNWGGREFYAFKVMQSEMKVQVIEGGHFFMPMDYESLQKMPLICNFISNSIMVTYYRGLQSELRFVTTSQFEYGVPFSLAQIEKHTAQEKSIAMISQGQYKPKFYNYERDQNPVMISQGVMESIRDGFQTANKLILNTKDIKITIHDQICYILSDGELIQVRLKKWDEYLYELSDSQDWDKCYQTAIDIHRGALTLLSNIPENDVKRSEAIKEVCCKLALTYMLLQIPNKQLRSHNAVLKVMEFLVKTQNEDYLFNSIEDLLSGLGYKSVFYRFLKDLIEQQSVNIPSNYILKVLRTLQELDEQETAVTLIMSLQNIDYDPKSIVDFCIEHDLIEPMMHVCSQTSDFLTPYLRILTLLQIQEFQAQQQQKDRQITTLSIQQLQSYLYNYIQFCLSGQMKDQEGYFTEKQYKRMLKDLFEYLFDQQNLENLFRIDYYYSLKVLLQVFSIKIQDIFRQLNQEGIEIHIRMSRTVEEGLLTEIICKLSYQLAINQTPKHLVSQSRIYALIKQAELTHFSNAHNLDNLYSVSAAFTCHVLAVCPLYFTLNHVLLQMKHYLYILRHQENSIFDINWVLRGRVQKDVPIDLIKNEFILKMIEKLEHLHPTYGQLESLKQKALDCKWTWLECWCLEKMNRKSESLYRYMQDQEILISERLFIVLGTMLKSKNEDAYDWLLKNMSLLAQEHSQKLFQLIYTYCRDKLVEISTYIEKFGVVPIDVKFNQQNVDLSIAFKEFMKPRLQI